MNFVRTFSEIGIDDVPLVGGKNASLGEMYRELTPLGVPVPNGFAVTADGYRAVLLANDLLPHLHRLLDGIDRASIDELHERAAQAHALVLNARLPKRLAAEIVASYRALLHEYGPEATVAVRSSATAEDLPTTSFAGQHESFLNVRDEEMLLEAYRTCLASLFLARAIHYRIDHGFDHLKVALSVGVMKNVRSDMASSGVAFTLDTESGFRDVVFITGSYGLGENVVQGTVAPDEFYVHKPTYEQGFRTVLRRRLGSKERRLVFAQGDSLRTRTENEETSAQERARFCITDDEVLTLAGYALAVERHYSRDHKHRVPVPMDIEWAKDGIDGRLYLVQARPETVASQHNRFAFDVFHLAAKTEPILSGRAVGTKIASGPVRIVTSAEQLSRVAPNDVLVAPTTSPDWEPVMRTCAAIVTDRGGRTCHAAIVARELGIPAIVGAERATTRLHEGAIATVSCASGETGYVYDGTLPFDVEHIDVRELEKPPVDIMTILADPESAFIQSHLPVAGVGLVRIEFVVSSIGLHPMAIAHPERLDDQMRARIAVLTGGRDPSSYFVERLSEGVGTIAAAFYPRPVIVRMSDFKTNEYASLLGGSLFEPHEENPMLGFRGASRYAHPNYSDGFALECRAMRRVRDEMGLTNVRLMIPFCRRLDEADNVLARMADLGLKRRDGLEIYLMCEIPNNVLQADEFGKRFDGFSIGSNDLTQLVLGVDRDSSTVAFDFDERDPGVLRMIRMAIDAAKRNGKRIGICGQAPSDYPDFSRWLIEAGIDSISLNPDTVIPTVLRLGTRSEVPVHFPTRSYASTV